MKIFKTCHLLFLVWFIFAMPDTYVIGYGKTAHFAHYFKIELLVFKGSVDLKQ